MKEIHPKAYTNISPHVIHKYTTAPAIINKEEFLEEYESFKSIIIAEKGKPGCRTARELAQTFLRTELDGGLSETQFPQIR